MELAMLWLREAEVSSRGLQQEPHPRVAAAQFDAVVVPGLLGEELDWLKTAVLSSWWKSYG